MVERFPVRRNSWLKLPAMAAWILMFWFVTPVFAQSGSGQGSATPERQSSEFEVVSIRPSDPSSMPNYSPSAGHFIVTNAPMINLVYFAYDIKYGYVFGAPSWFGNDRYDVKATLDPSSGAAMTKMDTKQRFAQLRPMVRAFLTDRLKLQVETQIKELPIYALVVARNGPKLKASIPTSPGEAPIAAKWSTSTSNGLLTITATNAELSGLVENLIVQPSVGKQVVDKTGIYGKYDFSLQWAIKPDSQDPAGPDIFTALQEQLGLKLESQKGSVATLLIQHVERPSEN